MSDVLQTIGALNNPGKQAMAMAANPGAMSAAQGLAPPAPSPQVASSTVNATNAPTRDPLAPLPADTAAPPPQAQAPVAPTPADAWKPKDESTLGKIGDVLLMLRGGQPIFRQRTDNANMASAMAEYRQNPSDQNLELATQRMSQIPDLAEKAVSMHNQLQQNLFYQGTAAERQMIGRNDALNKIGSLGQAINNSSDPDGNYQKMLPTLNTFAKSAGLPQLPDQYDKDALDNYASAAMTPYQKEELGIRQNAADALNQYRTVQEKVDIAKLGIDNQRLNIEGVNAQSNQVRAGAAAEQAGASNDNVYIKRFGLVSKAIGPSLVANAPWLPDYLAKTKQMPKPGTVYRSPDGSAGVGLVKGKWVAFQFQGNKPVPVKIIGGIGSSGASSDFAQDDNNNDE